MPYCDVPICRFTGVARGGACRNAGLYHVHERSLLRHVQQSSPDGRRQSEGAPQERAGLDRRLRARAHNP